MEFYAQDFRDVFKELDSDKHGLSLSEYRARQEKYGRNVLPPPKRKNMILRFLSQFNNLLIYLLLASSLISLILQHWVDAGVIFGVVFINALIGFFQEGKAEQALLSIQRLLTPKCIVVRNGVKHTVLSDDLVLGDVVVINAGDKVPADMRLFKTKNLTILESVLTGESTSVDKSVEKVVSKTPLAERSSMAYSGTLVTSGFGMGIVTATGIDTEIGNITKLLTQITKVTTPLLKKMQIFSRQLTFVIVGIAIVTMFLGTLLRDYTLTQMFMVAISLAVAAIPEGLPAVLTITLAIGVMRMAEHNAIFRKLPAVETMGSVTAICSDKTGTLTKNELTVQHLMTSNNDYFVTGSGYNDEGVIECDDSIIDINDHPELTILLRTGVLCNVADLYLEDHQWKMSGNPLEGALLAVALKAGIDIREVRKNEKIIDVIPFDSEKKLMAVLLQNNTNKYVAVKGSPEKIIELSKYQRVDESIESIDKKYWTSLCHILASEGQRLIAVAIKPDYKKDTLKIKDLDELVFLGVIGMIDPPRVEVKQAVQDCYTAGIDVKMITGDHAVTAQVVANQIGIHDHQRAYTGVELDQLSDEELIEQIDDMDIFSRTTPKHKLRLIAALQARGHVVAMTGDGVNDAPALKGADIGIAMGIKGSEVTREAADMVLADDNFATIRDAIREGRTVYTNIKKAILYILPNSFGEAMAIILAIVFGTILPITPLQILWINMVTTITLDISLAFEPTEKGTMNLPPRLPEEPLLPGYLVWRVFFVAFLMVAGAFSLFYYDLSISLSLTSARSVAVNAFVAAEIVYLLNCRKITTSSLSFEGLFGSRPALISIAIVIVLQLLFTYLPIMQHFFGVTGLSVGQWSYVLLFSVILFLAVELEKLINKKMFRKRKCMSQQNSKIGCRHP